MASYIQCDLILLSIGRTYISTDDIGLSAKHQRLWRRAEFPLPLLSDSLYFS
jgi:hypothetical protein